MKKDSPTRRGISTAFDPVKRKGRLATFAFFSLLALLVVGATPDMQAQKVKDAATARPKKLPSPEKIVGDYLKALGGKKRLAAIRDATYEWRIQVKGDVRGSARTQKKAPASTRSEMAVHPGKEQDGWMIDAASARSAWTRGGDTRVRTLTDAEAAGAKLKAALEASRLVDYKKLNVLARTVAYDETTIEPSYVVEFSTKDGARLRYWFGVKSKLLLKATDEAQRWTQLFRDYREESGILEPHQVEIAPESESPTILLLQAVRYNTGLSDSIFDPPAAETETPDITQLLREVEANQEKIDERVSEYAFTEKRVEREINDKGEVKKEKTTVAEIYPLPGGGAVYKLISEDGVPLSAERAAKQDKKIAEDVEKYEREREKREQKKKEEAEKAKGQPAKKKDEDDTDVSLTVFLRACEFVSPRREKLRDRETVVFDFRPRPGFRPKTTAENIVTKLNGVVWIDPVDKTIVRLEAKLAESYKMAGGLFISIRPGAGFTFEQTRMPDGVWLPRLIQVNLAAKFLLFKSIEQNETRVFSDYRRFNAEATDYKLGSPATNTNPPPKP